MIMTRARRLADMETLRDVRERSIVGLRGMLEQRHYYSSGYSKGYGVRIRASMRRKIARIRACDHALKLLDFAMDGPDIHG
jgi:hypothetical protein